MSGRLGALLFIPIQGARNVLIHTANFAHRYRRFVIFGGALISVMFLSDEYLFQIDHAHGNSMYPTIPERINWMYLNRTYRNGRGIQVGDCVQIRSPIFRKVYSGKRVIGLPGDYVLRSKHSHPTPGDAPMPGVTDWRQRLEGNTDNQEEEEWDEPEMIQVPEGHVWVEGDNLSWSRDSRFFGPVPMALICGRSSWYTDGWFGFTSLRPGKGLRKVEEDEMAAVLGG